MTVRPLRALPGQIRRPQLALTEQPLDLILPQSPPDELVYT
jgi:hypothetical protein